MGVARSSNSSNGSQAAGLLSLRPLPSPAPTAASNSSPTTSVRAIMGLVGRGLSARFGFLVSKSTDYGPRVWEA